MTALTDNERHLMTHISRFGSDGYPIEKLGRGWVWQRAFGAGGSPIVYRTKREATHAFEAYMSILRDRLAGRI